MLGGTGPASRRNQVKIGQCAAAAAGLFLGLILADTAQAQKQDGTLRVWHRDSPGNMSILEEGTISIIARLGQRAR